MKKDSFYKWLQTIKKYDQGTCNSRISNCQRIEKYYGDLDEIYAKDKCDNLKMEIKYSREDHRTGTSPKHKIPIDGDVYNGTATLRSALNLYLEFKDNEILQDIMTMEDVIPHEHDGSYELVRETAESLSNIDLHRIGIPDLDLLYFMVVGLWKGGIEFRLKKIEESNLPIEEKIRLKAIFNNVVEKAKTYKYENRDKSNWTIGMFGTGFYTFNGKADKENAQKFISLCIKIKDLDDEEEILTIAEESLKNGIKGMQAASASIVLHCLKPNVFPIINNAMIETAVLLESQGVILHRPDQLSTYIENSRKIRKFRDEKCKFKNYRALDLKLLEVEGLEEEIQYNEPKDTLIEQNPITKVKTYETYTKEEFLEEVFMEDSQYENIVNLLEYKKNIILQGPPGVGKTFVAKKIAYSIMGEKDDSRIEMVQFHQSYTYEDFIMGYRPVEEGFELKYGIFYQFCKRALNDPHSPYFFIIDEINRGNISKVFGELMMLIESDKRRSDYAIPLTYTENKFYIPENIYLIGTMNTADRSLAMLDYALRRRFCFIDIEAAFDNLNFKGCLESKSGELSNIIIDKMISLNKAIENDISLGRGFCIGHSYFCMDKDIIMEEDYRNIIKYEILPLLSEYWFDDYEKVMEWKSELLEW